MSNRNGTDAAPRGTGIPYMPALDGVRGIAILNIMGFHAGVWLTGGGFYSLDSFFALSGFLITSLLVGEWRTSGAIRLRAFWVRRARRLLPGLFLMLLGVSFVFGVLVPAGTYPSLRGDALSSLFYFANWHFIGSSSNYFDQSNLTSPLIHMWSLSVEEQFYLLWPLIVVAIFAIWHSLRVLLVVCVVGALASACEMALLFRPGNTTRIYFGTDTHAQSLLVGAALAVALAMWTERRARQDLRPEQRSPHHGADAAFDWDARTSGGRMWLTVIGFGGIVGSAILYTALNATDALAYRGGFLLASIATASVLLSISCATRSPVARILSFRPLTFVGRISYGAYLWHFPLFAYVDHARTGLSGWALAGVRVVPTLMVATVSFYLVERPIRTGTFLNSWRATVFVPCSVVAVTVAILLATVAPTNAVASAPAALPSLPATPIRTVIPSAYAAAPVRVLLIGDSEALTLGIGLSTALRVSPHRYHIVMVDKGLLACGVVNGTTFTKMGQPGQLVGWPCSPDPSAGICPQGVLAPHNSPCQARTAAWEDWIQEIDPNVVVLLAGAAEVFDRAYEGRTTNILNPAFAAYVKRQLETAVRIATARGALMVFMTKPCQDTGEQPDGSPWPEDSSKRQAVYNLLLHQVAEEDRGKVFIQDLNSYVCPKDKFTEDLNGVPVRTSDGVHFQFTGTGTGGDYLAPSILPYWEELGHLQEVETGGRSIEKTPPPSILAPA